MKFRIVLYITAKAEREKAAVEYMKIYFLHHIVHLFWTKLITQTSSFNIPTYRTGVFRQWKVYLHIHLRFSLHLN